MTGLIARARGARTTLLTLAGFSSLTASAWVSFGIGAGLAALGASALVLEYLTDDQGEEKRL